MAVLHIVNRSSALTSCLDTASPDDTIVLIENGVYAGSDLKPDRQLFAIDVDVRARGLTGRLAAHVAVATYSDFVRLAETHTPIVTWR